MNYVPIRVPDPPNEDPNVSACRQLETLQAQLDQLRSTLSPDVAPQVVDGEPPNTQLVQDILKTRRRREKVFGSDLFGEPAWDILLELYAAEQLQEKISVSSLCYASAVPATTALRWIQRLEANGLVRRRDDPLDGRRSFLELDAQVSADLRKFLAHVPIRPV